MQTKLTQLEADSGIYLVFDRDTSDHLGTVTKRTERNRQMSGRTLVGHTERSVWDAETATTGDERKGYATRSAAVAAVVGLVEAYNDQVAEDAATDTETDLAGALADAILHFATVGEMPPVEEEEDEAHRAIVEANAGRIQKEADWLYESALLAGYRILEDS